MANDEVTEKLDRNKDTVREFFARLERGDVTAAFEMFVDNATWFSPTMRSDRPCTEMVGKVGWLFDAMPDGIRFELGPFTAEDDRVAVVAESYSTMVTGRVYNNVYHWLFEVRDGRLLRAWEFSDTQHIMDVMVDLPGFDVARTPDSAPR